mmetsp:Transcript_14763/g.33741  ORF Transcript_14763/g.33741 Transcript_14763/m.33741 type:complete len:278 (+) Transcript_14763:536-1369(+)
MMARRKRSHRRAGILTSTAYTAPRKRMCASARSPSPLASELAHLGRVQRVLLGRRRNARSSRAQESFIRRSERGSAGGSDLGRQIEIGRSAVVRRQQRRIASDSRSGIAASLAFGHRQQRTDLLRCGRHLLLCADHDDEPLVGKEAGRRALLEQRKDVTARRGLDLLEDGAGFADDLAGVRILYGDVIANVALDAFEPLDMRVGCVVEVGRWPIGKEDLPSLRGDRLPRRAAACSCRASRHTSHMRERARRERARRHPECTSRCRRRIGQSTTAERA